MSNQKWRSHILDTIYILITYSGRVRYYSDYEKSTKFRLRSLKKLQTPFLISEKKFGTTIFTKSF